MPQTVADDWPLMTNTGRSQQLIYNRTHTHLIYHVFIMHEFMLIWGKVSIECTQVCRLFELFYVNISCVSYGL